MVWKWVLEAIIARQRSVWEAINLKIINSAGFVMVEAGDKKAQKPSAEELAQAEHYEAMMAAVARDDEDDYDVEDDEDFSNGAPLDIDNQSLLMARMMQQAQQY